MSVLPAAVANEVSTYDALPALSTVPIASVYDWPARNTPSGTANDVADPGRVTDSSKPSAGCSIRTL